jgi:DNA-binding MarR family transcriptional regulator
MKHDSLMAADCKLAQSTQEIRDKLQSALAIVEELEPLSSTSRRFSPEQQGNVRDLLKSRRARDQFFDSSLFADPAWDILLELYAAELGQQRISVSTLCAAAAVPATTALRWIKILEKNGLLVRTDDPMDGRRTFISLAPDAFDRMERYFATVPLAC